MEGTSKFYPWIICISGYSLYFSFQVVSSSVRNLHELNAMAWKAMVSWDATDEFEASPVISSYLKLAKNELAEANMSKPEMMLTEEAVP